MKYLRPIDPHVHLRGEEYAEHDFLGMAIDDANAVGLKAFIEMPNCTPNLTTMELMQERSIHAAKRISERDLDGWGLEWGCHVGLTDDAEQVHQALLLTERNRTIHADKTFYCHSTGRMGIIDPEIQEKLWRLKGEMNYKGVSIGHFEAEDFYVDCFDPANPASHSEAQPEAAELEQVHRQLLLAQKYGFEGTFYIAHVSSPETVRLVHTIRETVPFKIILEATFHHILLNVEDYRSMGNLVKMNPPLRSKESQREMLQYVVSGYIDILGTDHAPHTHEAKSSNKPPSGIPALPFWPKGIEILKTNGIQQDILDRITFGTANELFGLYLEPEEVDIVYDPGRWKRYGYNPFENVEAAYKLGRAFR